MLSAPTVTAPASSRRWITVALRSVFSDEVDPVALLLQRHIREHVQRKHDIVLHVEGIEKRTALEYHTDCLTEGLTFLLVETGETLAAIEDFSVVDLFETHHAFHEYGLTRSGSADDQVDLTLTETGRNVRQNPAFVKALGDIT